MNRNMNMLKHNPFKRNARSIAAASVLGLASGLSLPALAAFDGEAVPPEHEAAYTQQLTGDSSQSRAAVQAELVQAREAGTKTPDGEIGDTTAVLAARERSNAEMTVRLVAEAEAQVQQAELMRRQALAEAEQAELVRRQAAADAERQLAQARSGEVPTESVDPTGSTPPLRARSAAEGEGVAVRRADAP